MENNIRGGEGDIGSASESRGMSGVGHEGQGRKNAANLSHEARVKGGQRSAQVQVRDEHGQFAGRKGGEGNAQSRSRGSPENEASHSGG
jgi:hypothetical protein